ncbi:MAG: hypothetical protein PUD17_02025 [Treponema sp.]|uniref:hypothetical protein n=1 Tax=Treponema sp. TaxID=166 RepID=UPI00298EB82B|nr:hypothetical protein [Treponema sp.]MDD5810854.1 hypothetical protein [Treponema sp.]
MDRLFENRRQERIVKILKMIKEGKIVNRNTIGDLGVGDTATSRDFESIMYDLRLPIKYDGKLHSYVATADFEIPWRVVNDEIGEILQDSKDTLQSLLGKDNSNQQLQHLLDNISKIESINSEKMFLIEKPGVNL